MKEKEGEQLTLKSLQKHIVFTIVGCLVVAVFSAFITVASTKNDVEELKNISIEHTSGLKDLKQAVNNINLKVQENSTPTSVNQVEINNLKQDVKEVKDQVDKIYNVMLELKTRRDERH